MSEKSVYDRPLSDDFPPLEDGEEIHPEVDEMIRQEIQSALEAKKAGNAGFISNNVFMLSY